MAIDRTLPVQRDDLAPWLTAYASDADLTERHHSSEAAGHGQPLDLNCPAAEGEPRLTVVVPTRNEEDNIRPLLRRLGPGLATLNAEIIVVDDSDDGTPTTLAASAETCPVLVRLLHRPPGLRKGGLSSAVITGARLARGDRVLVMDADLQHPPETAVVLADTAMRRDCDVVVGTRYAGRGSSVDGLDGRGRRLVSSWATVVVKSLFPRRLATVSDPLSGLFAFRRAAVDLDRLKPVGFKILLEILVRTPAATVTEVAYRFTARNSGESKASLRQGLTFLRHVSRLRRTVPVSRYSKVSCQQFTSNAPTDAEVTKSSSRTSCNRHLLQHSGRRTCSR